MKKSIFLGSTTLIIMAICRFYFHNLIADPDTFYHFKLAQFIAHGQVLQQFPWNHFTIFTTSFMDHHFLFHVLLVPFAVIQPLYGLDIFLVLQALVLVTLLGYALYKIHSSTAVLSIVPLIFSVPFLFVMNVGRAKIFSVLILVIGTLLIERRRHVALFLLAALFTLSYNAFFLLLMLSLVYWALILVLQKKWNWAPVAVLGGIVAGVVLHPNFPQNVHFYVVHIRDIAIFPINIPRGVEWLPYSLVDFFKQNTVIVFIYLSSIFLLGRKGKLALNNIQELWVFAISLIFLIATFRSQVFVIYWVIFAVLFSGYELVPYFSQINWKHLKQIFLNFWQAWAAALVFLLIVVGITYHNAVTVRAFLVQGTPFSYYRNAAQWLQDNSKPGDIVFNPQWDQFPQLFYWDDKNYYIVGMDPTFMYVYNKDLYWQWREVSDDNPAEWGTADDLYHIVKGEFNSSYVFVENKRNPRLKAVLDKAALENLKFQSVYNDQNVSLYQVN